MKPRVSIVTPSFNQADFLEETIRSVLMQDYPDLEYLVVDGGSTDGSIEIIRKYADRLAYWTSEPDEGQAHAINKGLARASGEFVAWINSDDLYRPGAVSGAVAGLLANPQAGMVFANATSIDAHGQPMNDMVFTPRTLDDLLAFEIICQPAVFMRRRALEQAGYLDPRFHYLLDHQLWIRLARQAPVVHIPAFWAFARHHPTAKNVAQASNFGQEAYRILEWARQRPDLAEMLERNRRRYWAGAHRFNGRYLLDGGQAGPALRSYLKALAQHPATALSEWHRMFFALLSMLGGQGAGRIYYRWKRRRSPQSVRLTAARADINREQQAGKG